MTQQLAWAPDAPSGSVAPSGVRPLGLVLWGLAALVAVALLVANVVLAVRGDHDLLAQPDAAATAAAPAQPPRPTHTSAQATVPSYSRPLAAYVFPDAVGQYLFVSKGRAGGDEVGYYASTKGALNLSKKANQTLQNVVEGGTELDHLERFWCWRNEHREFLCGAQMRDGVLTMVANDKETYGNVTAMMNEVVKGL